MDYDYNLIVFCTETLAKLRELDISLEQIRQKIKDFEFRVLTLRHKTSKEKKHA